ncbi:MAG: aspartate/glutamate racemase family protein [Erysipelotrichaceae bacterium]|nr:aspartate/glutamate racemase family protein [Erysipelotrichaceae bacterium]
MSKIGVLDSGIGGMILLEHLKERYPMQDFLFFADQIHSPYGSKSEDELIEIVNRNIAWLKMQGAESILFACNTICALNPSRISKDLPIQRIIEPTCRQLLDQDVHSILVCATPFTVKKGIYPEIIHRLLKEVEVESVALPYLCRDVEEMTDDRLVFEKLKNDLGQYVGKMDAVILGCTHYPAVSHLFKQLFDVPVFDSNGIELVYSSLGTGNVQYVTTDSAEIFDKQCSKLFKTDIHSSKVEL